MFEILMTGNRAIGAGDGFGIFGGGYTGTSSTYTDKYTYSSNAVAAGSVLRLE